MWILGMMGEIRHAIGEPQDTGRLEETTSVGFSDSYARLQTSVQDCIVEERCIS